MVRYRSSGPVSRGVEGEGARYPWRWGGGGSEDQGITGSEIFQDQEVTGMNFHKPPLRNLNWIVLGLARAVSGLLMILCLGFFYIDLGIVWTEYLVHLRYRSMERN